MMSRETINSWNHLGVRGPDGVLETLPFRVWIYEPAWYSKLKSCTDRKPFFRVEWLSLDLQSGELSETLSTMPYEARNKGTAVASGNRVYVLGGAGGGDPFCPDKILLPQHNNCVFYFDCASPGCEWKKAPPMLVPRRNPSAVATGGKIYVFGSTPPTGGHFAEVFNVHQNRWDELPAPPVASCLYPESVSHPVLFDSSRSRLLVHFASNGSLYAFHPDDGSWECIDPVFGFYFGASVIVEDVVYFMFGAVSEWINDSRQYFRAYHVVHKKWLSIHWHSDSPLPVGDFPNLFHLGNGILCLALYCEGCVLYIKFCVLFHDGKIDATAEPEPSTATFPSGSLDFEVSGALELRQDPCRG